MLRINSNWLSTQTDNALGSHWNSLKKTMGHLASGKAINSASDNAAGLAISMQQLAQLTAQNQASANSQDGINMLQTADGGLSQTQDLLQQARTLQVQSLNGTLTSSDQQAIQDQLNQITQQINQVSGNTQFNDKNLLDGTANNVTLQTGPNAGQTTTVSISNASATALGVPSITAGNSADLTNIDNALSTVSSQRAQIGAQVNGLTANIQDQQIGAQNNAASYSSISDQDMAAGASQMVQQQILSQSSLAMAAQTNQMSSTILSLLQ